MTISCSNCGKSRRFKYSAANVIHTVYDMGWGSYGAVIYCPECTRTWDKRNKGRPIPGPENTIDVIDMLYRNSKRRYEP